MADTVQPVMYPAAARAGMASDPLAYFRSTQAAEQYAVVDLAAAPRPRLSCPHHAPRWPMRAKVDGPARRLAAPPGGDFAAPEAARPRPPSLRSRGSTSSALSSFHAAYPGERAGLSNAGLSKEGLSNAGLSKAGLPNAGVSNAGLSKAAVSNAGVSKAGLSNAGLSNAGVSKAGLSNAGLSKAGLSNAGVSKAGLSNAGLSKEGLSNAGTPPPRPELGRRSAGPGLLARLTSAGPSAANGPRRERRRLAREGGPRRASAKQDAGISDLVHYSWTTPVPSFSLRDLEIQNEVYASKG